MAYPQAYINYLAHYHGDRDFFECHEILEEYWKEHPDSSDRSVWLGLIQLAVSMYHHRRGNLNGALKMLRGAVRHLEPRLCRSIGLDGEQLQQLLLERLHAFEEGSPGPYRDLDLPFADAALLQSCQTAASGMGFQWGAPSGRKPGLIHRHTQRDRSDVVLEREQAARRKKAERRAGLGATGQHSDH